MRADFSVTAGVSVYRLIILLIFGIALLVGRVSAAQEDFEPEAVVGQALVERFGTQMPATAIRKVVISADEVRRIVRDQIDPLLLHKLRQTSGADFRFVLPTGQGEAQVGVIVLSYDNSQKPVGLMQTVGRCCNGYLRKTKILMPLSATPVRNQLVIVFTENAGSDDVVAFVRQMPKHLRVVHK